MHHSDPSGETTGSRRMSHPSVFTGCRGSNTGGVPADEHQTAAGSSSPGPHHPPHSLGIHPQTPSVGAQVKKKSGFQITSVLPAQVSASANNSIADDTESYDDMDESHTEDLSSSDILDVSVSRATDTGVPERSSSEETLNSLHGGETPGVVSPNDPVLHHAQQGYMVNGVHHAHHHHSHHKTAQRTPAVVPAASSGPVAQGRVTGGRAVQAAVVEGGGVLPTPPVTGTSAAPDTATIIQPPPPSTAVTQTQTTAASTASRFRVVKLDSNSEPFRKGRWTCAEFYEKDAPAGDSAAAHRTVENIIHSEHESASGSSSGSTLSGGDVQQNHAGPPPQLHARPQEPSVNPQVTGVMGTDTSSAPLRPQQPVVYAVEGQMPPVQSGYPTKPPVSVALPPMEYIQISANVQPAAQPLQIPPVQSAVSLRAAPVPTGIPGLPVAQPVSPRPQAPAPPMGVPLHLDQQQTGPQLSSSAASGPHGAVIQAQQGGRVPLAGVMSGVTASQLEDAQRLLLQHHPLLSLPRLTASGGLAGSTAADGGADAAFAVSTGADEDSSSGASVVAIDNKIEQAMDLVKSHLMYAVREEVEVLKEQIKELIERNSQLEQENTLLKNLASPEQLAQFQAQVQDDSPTAGPPAVLPQSLPPNQGPGPCQDGHDGTSE